MKYFCSKCGKTTQYGIELPKFCSYCGQSFANKVPTKETEDKRNNFLNELKLKKNVNPINIKEDILYNSYGDSDYDKNNEYIVNNFNKVKPSFKLNIYKNNSESFGSLIDNPSKSASETILPQAEPNKTSEEILNVFQKEAGSLRLK